MSCQKRRQVSTLHFPPGAVLGLYADGLAQRRDQPIDQASPSCAQPSPRAILRLECGRYDSQA
jgi:hypothetical protein